jgi:membrane fusion protein (multidrug efflux system)
MKTRIFLALAFVALIIASLAGIKALQIRKLMQQPWVMPPETIATAIAEEKPWQTTFSAIASVTAAQGVTIANEISGVVTEIAFQSGATVATGDLLVRLDTSSEEAELRAMDAQVQLAQLNVERVRQLRTANTLSQAELDAAEATLKQHQAGADRIRASIAKKTLRAPFAGRLGIRLVNLGEFLDSGKPIVSLQSLAPIHVEFSLPQQDVAALVTGLAVVISTDAYPESKFSGTLTAINPALDATTRSVRLQATIANEDQRLRPGMFARVEVILPDTKPALVIPVTAVLSAPYGNSVYLVEPSTNGLVARQQFIRTGRARGDFVSVESGLKAGQKVVSAGQFKLRTGMTVKENNEMTPAASEKPKPNDG